MRFPDFGSTLLIAPQSSATHPNWPRHFGSPKLVGHVAGLMESTWASQVQMKSKPRLQIYTESLSASRVSRPFHARAAKFCVHTPGPSELQLKLQRRQRIEVALLTLLGSPDLCPFYRLDMTRDISAAAFNLKAVHLRELRLVRVAILQRTPLVTGRLSSKGCSKHAVPTRSQGSSTEKMRAQSSSLTASTAPKDTFIMDNCFLKENGQGKCHS